MSCAMVLLPTALVLLLLALQRAAFAVMLSSAIGLNVNEHKDAVTIS